MIIVNKYRNKNAIVICLILIQFILLVYGRPKPDEGGVGLEDIAIDVDAIKSYTDGSWKDKYNDTFDGYEAAQKHNCKGMDDQEGCHYTRNSSLGSDWLGHTSNFKAVLGAGYEHEKQIVYGTEAEHKGKVQLGESRFKYEGEAVSSAKYDETLLGGSIGPKVGGSVQATAFGVGVGAGLRVGIAAEGGYNSHEKNVALKATTPVGEYGLKVGCKNEVCIVACLSISVC